MENEIAQAILRLEQAIRHSTLIQAIQILAIVICLIAIAFTLK